MFEDDNLVKVEEKVPDCPNQHIKEENDAKEEISEEEKRELFLEFILDNMLTNTSNTIKTNDGNCYEDFTTPRENEASSPSSTKATNGIQLLEDEESTNSSTNNTNNNNNCTYDDYQKALSLLMAIHNKHKLESSNKITPRKESNPFCSFKMMIKLLIIIIVGLWCMLTFLSDVQQHAPSFEYFEDDVYEFNHHNILFVMAKEPPALSTAAFDEIMSRSSVISNTKDDQYSLWSRRGLNNIAASVGSLWRRGSESNVDVQSRCLVDTISKCDNSRKLQLIQFNWLGPTVDANVAKIVLEEKLGICAEIITMNVTDALIEMAATGTRKYYAMLEFWSESRRYQYDKYVVNDKTIIDAGELGINAKLGWYILGFMKTEYDLIDEYREYRTDKAAFYLATNATYPLGRFVGGAKSWITFDDQIISNLKLKLKIEYTPEKDAEKQLTAKIEEANTKKQPILFYMWYPHELFGKLDIKNVYLPPSNAETCWTAFNQENHLIDCDYPTEILRKLMSPRTMADSVLNSFFSRFTYESTDQIEILADIVYEKMSVVDASCKWLRNNTKRVSYWVTDNNTSNSGSVIGIVIAALFVISLFFCTVFITGLILYFMYRKNLRKRALKFAPKVTPFTLVFTDIQNSTLLWSTASDKMKSVLAIHNLIMRSNIQKYKGYEAKTAGDSFTVAFVDPMRALAFCISVQKELLLANWPSESLQLADMKEVRWNENLIYRGPRIRMGVHTGSDCNISIDKKTHRMEYVGNMVHLANKIEASSVGGRIYCSASFVKAIKNKLTLFDSNSSTGKSSKEESNSSHYYDESTDKGLSKYIQELQNNLIEFEDLGEKQELDIMGTKHRLLMVKDLGFPRTLWIQQFERVLEESPVEEQQVISQKLDLIEEIEKYITEPNAFGAERRSKLIYDFINNTNDTDQTLPPWKPNTFTDLFDSAFQMVTGHYLKIKEE